MRLERDEQGSILPMTVLIVTVVLTFSAFAVDLGLARVARQDMQSLSDAVALDAARKMGGRTKAEIEADPKWQLGKNTTMDRNASTVGSEPDVNLRLGFVDKDTGVFREALPSERPTAVKAESATTVGFAFAGGEGGAARSAVAMIDPATCFSVGSFAASLSSSDSPLLSIVNKVLDVDLKVLSSEGILTLQKTEVPLLDLAAELGVGTAEELLDASVSLGQLSLAIASVLNKNGETIAAGLFNEAFTTKISAVPGNFKVGELLNLGSGDDAALDLGVNVLDFISAGLVLASQGHAVSLPVSVNLPGIAAMGLKVQIVEPPQIACGRPGEAKAKAAQLRLELHGDVLKGVEGVKIANSKLDVRLGVAAAEGTLSAVRCGPASGGDQITVSAKSGLLTTDVELNLTLLQILFLNVGVNIKAGPAVAAERSEVLTLTYPEPPAEHLPSASISGQLNRLGLVGLTPKVKTDIVIVSWVLDPILSLVLSGLLQPVLAAVDTLLTPILNPVLKLLGVELGGAEVAALGRPNCDSPKLVG